VLGFSLYAMTIHYDWFIFDDSLHILDNDNIKDISFSGFLHFWTDASSKIPITYHVWQILTAIFGHADPAPFRFVNILFHCFNTILLYYFIQKLWSILKKENSLEKIYLPAFFGSLFFLIHPVQVESVVWISSLKGVLSTFFSLVSLCLYLKTIERPKRLILYLSLITLSLGLAVLSKPSAVTLPLLYILLDLYLFKVPLKFSLLKNTHLAFIGLIFAVLQIVEYTSGRSGIDHAWYKQLVMIPSSISKYLQLVFYPVNLKFNYGYNYDWITEILKTDHFTLRVHLIFALLFFWLIILFTFLKKGRFKLIGFSLLFFIISISVNVGFVYYGFMNISTVADRYLYFPIIGFSILVAFMVDYIKPLFHKYYYMLMSGLFAVLVFFTINQNKSWNKQERISNATIQEFGNVHISLVEPLIGDLINNNEIKKAFELFVSSHKKLPDQGENFARELLDVFAEKKLVEMGDALIDIAGINFIKLESRDIVDFYIESGQFLKARHYIEKNKEDFARIDYKNFNDRLKHQWFETRFMAAKTYIQILSEYNQLEIALKFLEKEELFYLDHHFNEWSLGQLRQLKDETIKKEKLRSALKEALKNPSKVDKVEALLKSYQ
jgi:hypothetical protein